MAIVNWRLSYMRCALLIRAAVILGLRPAGAAARACGGEAGEGAFFDEGGFVFGHEGEHAEDEFAVGGSGVDDAVGQGFDADAAGSEGGDEGD